MVSNVETNLHVYVKYEEENSMRVFSVNNADQCTVSDRIPMNHKKDQWVRSTPLGNVQLYSLSYQYQSRDGRSSQKPDPNDQDFCAYTSVDMRTKTPVKQPPVVFGDADLCTVENNINTYNKTLNQPVVKTKASVSFQEEELGRGVYNYNAEVDTWYPVPAMKNQVRDSCMVTCCNSLFLIGGCEAEESSGCGNKYAQAYDYREKSWRNLPPSNYEHVGADCCELNGEIYVCGGVGQGAGNTAERYDPKAGKWDEVSSMSMEMRYHELSSYSDMLWSTGGFSAAGRPVSNLSMLVYQPSKDQWGTSSVLMEASRRTDGQPTAILDAVVFKASH